MTAAEWERIKDLFESALDLAPEARPRFLADACQGDEPTRLEIERLLQGHDRAGGFLEEALLPAMAESGTRDQSLAFAVADVAAGRFRITRFIGRGGMGEVYEAEDLDLHERVALKTLRPEVAVGERYLEALQREVHHARKVTHPNVNRIFDLTRHRRPDGDETAFLTMELLEGETLAERLQRAGPMTPSEALPLIEQMAAGLGAAHEAGVVHRDFKPGNVMLVPAVAGASRAVITDFGLARAMDAAVAGGESYSGSATGVFGTPPYIAPEQLAGGGVSAAADVYALGVVIDEMLGKAPRSGKWRQIVGRCRERDPARRFASAAEVAAAVAAPRRSPWRRTVLAAALLVAACAGAIWWLLLPHSAIRLVPSHQHTVTDDGQMKKWAVADASWLYFAEKVGFRSVLAKVPLSGGHTERLPTRFLNAQILDISPDRTELLVVAYDHDYIGPNESSPLWRVPVSGMAPRPLGSITARAATWSADGKQVAYAAGRDLLQVDAEGRNPRKIVTVPGEIAMVRWSPGGNTLAFQIDRPRDAAGAWTVNSDGSGLRPLTPPLAGRHRLSRQIWTPNGKHLIFSLEDGLVGLVPPRGGVIPQLGRTPITFNLTSGDLSWLSAEGKAYAIVGGRAQIEYMAYDRLARDVRSLLSLSGISANEPAFSPDAKWVAYRSTEYRLWRSKIDGTGAVLLVKPSLGGALPAWSPDGRQIAFMAGPGGEKTRVYLAPRDGGEPKQLVPAHLWPADPHDHWQGGPTWSPDGKKIAFGENGDHFPISPSCAIHIYDIGTQRVSTVPHSDGLWTARWSTDGRYLAALTRDNEKLMLYDFQTQKWVQLDDGYIGENPAWSHDGHYLYYLKPYADPPAILRRRVPHGRPEQVADLTVLDRHRGSFMLWSGLAPGDIPLLQRREGNDEIDAFDLKLP
ncbi:MAG: protein kinase [Bryobacteraceae bacterium]